MKKNKILTYALLKAILNRMSDKALKDKVQIQTEDSEFHFANIAFDETMFIQIRD